MVSYTHDVLISGAGPAGLMMACQLAIQDTSFRIIDTKRFPADYSGALIIHSRTMEIFKQMGIAEKVINAGIKVNRLNIRFNKKKIITVEFDKLQENLTNYPFFLLLKQGYTEKLLTEFLNEKGYSVESNTTLLTFKQDNDFVVSQIEKPDETIETVNSRFLIAADGANSHIRTQLKIPFTGKTHSALLYITDCKTSLPLSGNEIYFDFASTYTTGFFPLPDNKWRSDGMVPAFQKMKKEVSFEDIQGFFSGHVQPPVELYEKQWFSVFKSHSRCAAMFRQKHCFLIGDASHVHSPVGAQGMNTGFQDAYNLAWKLTFFIRKEASENLLDTYQEERKPLALQVIRYTDLVFALITNEFFVIKLLRLYFFPLLLTWFNKSIYLRKRIFISVSGLGIKYRSVLKPHLDRVLSFHAPGPGELLPYISFKMKGKDYTLYDGLSSRTFHLFVFAKDVIPLPFKLVTEKYSNLISIKCIDYEEGTKNLFLQLGVNNGGYYLVRPDLYIALRNSGFDSKNLEHFFQKFLK